MKKIFLILILIFFPIISYSEVWQKINENYNIYRMKVPHGWIICSEATGNGGINIIFYPDELHEWNLKASKYESKSNLSN